MKWRQLTDGCESATTPVQAGGRVCATSGEHPHISASIKKEAAREVVTVGRRLVLQHPTHQARARRPLVGDFDPLHDSVACGGSGCRLSLFVTWRQVLGGRTPRRDG